jgi:hypothetical protein
VIPIKKVFNRNAVGSVTSPSRRSKEVMGGDSFPAQDDERFKDV